MSTDYRIFVDTEYVYPGMRKNTPRPTAVDKRQIVQIAAILWDCRYGKEISSFNMIVKPTYQKRLPGFFVELTGITSVDISQQGIRFSQALRHFRDFCGNVPVWTFDKDEEVFLQNCTYCSVDFPFKRQFTRVKPLLAGWAIDASQFSSGTLYKAAGLDMDGHVHNALHDVRSMAAAVHTFENKS